MNFTIDKDIGEPIQFISTQGIIPDFIIEQTKVIARHKSRTLDEWLMRCGVNDKSVGKFRLDIQNTPNHKAEHRYDLYPARGRNAKKIISSLYI